MDKSTFEALASERVEGKGGRNQHCKNAAKGREKGKAVAPSPVIAVAGGVLDGRGALAADLAHRQHVQLRQRRGANAVSASARQ